MSFRDFSFPKVEQDLGLHVRDADLFPTAPDVPVRESVAEVVREGAQLALANSTEKAKSEFIIAPVLLELRRLAGGKIALFSGVEWDVDSARGLAGYCDFILTKGGSEHVLRAPFVAVVEAKNDLIRTGLGQCIASMYAARISNERTHERAGPVFGVVTTPKTGPERSWERSLLIRAAYMEAMHCPRPVRIRSFLASTTGTNGARSTCSLPPLVMMKSQ